MLENLFYFCHLKKLVRPETFGPLSCTRVPTLQIYLLVCYLTVLCRQNYRTRMVEKLHDNKLERAWKKRCQVLIRGTGATLPGGQDKIRLTSVRLTGVRADF